VVFVLGSMAHWTSGLTVPGMGFEKDRLAGMLIDPNAYGGLLVMTLSIHLMTYCGNRPLVGGLLGKLVTMSLAIGVVLTYSRSAWLGLALLFLAAMIMRPKAGVYMVLMGLLAVALTLKGFGPDYASRMSELTFRGAQVHERVELIDQAIPLFRESPAFGIGMGVFNDIYGNIIHNTPVWILTECGVFGFIIFVGFAWWFLARGIDALRVGTEAQRSLVLGLMLANLAMMGLSMGIEALYQRHWWVVLALLAACYDLTRVQCRRPAVGG
jgi:O-antigen ligase